MTATVLALPNFSLPFVIETDDCDHRAGAVLQQGGHPIAFLSKALAPKLQGLSTYEKVFLALIMAVDQLRSYIQHSEFVIQTDHKSLVHLEEQRLHTEWQKKAFTKLLGMIYRIRYKKGSENHAADALSRQTHEETLYVSTVSKCKPVWLEEVVQGYNTDVQAQKILTNLALLNGLFGKYSLRSGIIYFQGRVWIGNNTDLQLKIIRAFHDSPLGGILVCQLL